MKIKQLFIILVILAFSKLNAQTTSYKWANSLIYGQDQDYFKNKDLVIDNNGNSIMVCCH